MGGAHFDLSAHRPRPKTKSGHGHPGGEFEVVVFTQTMGRDVTATRIGARKLGYPMKKPFADQTEHARSAHPKSVDGLSKFTECLSCMRGSTRLS